MWLFEDVGAVVYTVRLDQVETGVVLQERVAPKKRPDYLKAKDTCREIIQQFDK